LIDNSLTEKMNVKQLCARNLYLRGVSDDENALETGVSRQTILNWKKKFGWKQDRIAIADKARTKSIESYSDKLAETKDSLDVDHKEMMSNLRSEIKVLTKKGAHASVQDIRVLTGLSNLVREFVKLEREVHGLDLMQKVPPMVFPDGFSITVKSRDGTVQEISEVGEDYEEELESSLPNQHESSYGHAIDADLVEDEVYDEEEPQDNTPLSLGL
jgi:transposase